MPVVKRAVPVSAPDVRVVRWRADRLHHGIKPAYTIARVDSGTTEWIAHGRIWRSTPGSFQIKQPGDVHRDIAHAGVVAYQIVVLSEDLVRSLVRRVAVEPHLASDDVRARAFVRLHAAVDQGAERLVIDVAAAEAVAALAGGDPATPSSTRRVRRALELMHDCFAEPLTLDQIAAEADVDKFHLCRAFRDQLGMPPHAYLTHLRVRRAKELLSAGGKPSDVAARVGLYDQSALNRHFRRIVGTTPGRFAKRENARSRDSFVRRE